MLLSGRGDSDSPGAQGGCGGGPRGKVAGGEAGRGLFILMSSS